MPIQHANSIQELNSLSRQISDVNKGVVEGSKDVRNSKNIFTFTGLKIKTVKSLTFGAAYTTN